ncbi:NIPSNAP family protein [Peristeroidobacter agariperforans]|uniref:NIPSNAP family protein n=1 Tax=Peristeroidobacter agariperforans TaxID=268404 RepID=UPI00101C03F9|nr:NIPSNAP family protein [Peristeroidobacter agariperforans]
MAKEFLRTTVLALAAVLLLATVPQLASAAEQPRVIHQLRIYQIFENNKQAFHERFRDHAMRIMAKYDFKIVAQWETRHEERTEFVYLLQWPDQATLTDRWARFMADQEWAAIKKRTAAQHGQLVGDIEDRVLTVQDYSPTQVFQ